MSSTAGEHVVPQAVNERRDPVLGSPDDRPITLDEHRTLHQPRVLEEQIDHGVRRGVVVGVEPELLEVRVLAYEVGRRVLEDLEQMCQRGPVQWRLEVLHDVVLRAELAKGRQRLLRGAAGRVVVHGDGRHRADGTWSRARLEASMAAEELLESWNDTETRRAIVDFVEAVAGDGPDVVPPEQRVAVFDNDGTLWTEKPMPTQLHYIVKKWREQIAADPSLAERQPYQAVASGDLAWLGRAIDKHYDGDDSDLRLIIKEILQITANRTVDDYAAEIADFYRDEEHQELQRPYSEAVYQPMVELVAVPRGQPLRDLHRLRRRARLHAADEHELLRHPARARHRLVDGPPVRRGRIRR